MISLGEDYEMLLLDTSPHVDPAVLYLLKLRVRLSN
jgi:hypothetical protein